jgi:hypothetical protein
MPSKGTKGSAGGGLSAEEIAEQLGTPAEKTYPCSLEEAPVPPKRGKKTRHNGCKLKVGGMGLSVLASKGNSLIETFLYINLVGWRYSCIDESLIVDIGEPGAKAQRTIKIETKKGEEIGKLMETHALLVKNAKRAREKEQKAQLSELVGKYRVESRATLREGCEMDSLQVEAPLGPGTIIDVTAVDINSMGVVRLQCEQGWVSNKPHLVVRLDEDGNPIETQAKERVMEHIEGGGSGGSEAEAGGGDAPSVEDIMEELGLTGEKSFEVQQSHIKKKVRALVHRA